MRVNIYLPDDLAADIKAELGEANVSGIAQSALRAELARARGLQEALAAEDGFQRIEAVEGEEDVAFQGRKIGSDGRHLTAYLTPKGNIAVVGERGNLLDVYDECEAFIVDYGDTHQPGRQEMVREVAKALGVKSVRELDI